MGDPMGSHPPQWPPPWLAKALRVLATGLMAGSAASAFTGHATFAGILATSAAVMALVDVVTSP